MNADTPTAPNVRDLLDLTGKTALVTGATGYLGRHLARGLAEAGATVAATSRDRQRALELTATLPTPAGQTHQAFELDYLNEDSITSGFEAAVESAGRIDILVNNGHAASASDWRQVTGEQFTRQLANASGYFLLSRHLRDHAVGQQAPASIINLSSMYGLVGSYPQAYEHMGPASPVAYQTLKAGVIQMTRHLAVYWAADQIRVNCLCPGAFPNPATAPQELTDRLETRCPLGRVGNPFELKGAVVFLASAASSYMTGQNLVIDGGWTAW